MSLFGASTATNPIQNSANTAFPRSMSFSTATGNKGFSFGGQNTTGTQAQPSGLFGSAASNNTGGTSLFGNAASNTGGLFGQNTAQTNSTGFGVPGQNNSSANTGNSLFGQNGTTTSNAGVSLFGQNNTSSTATGGLFGQSNNSSSATGGGLFGQNSASTSNTGGGGLFGQNNTLSNTTSGGLFGQNNPSTSNTGGSLFGTAKSQPSANTGGGLFGQNTSQANTGTGLFGQSTNTTSVFGSQQNATGQNFFGSQTVPTALGTSLTAYVLLLTNLRPSQNTSPLMQYPYYQRERYNELPEPQRTLLDSMDKYISSQTQIKHELRARNANESMRQLMTYVHELMSEQQALTAALQADSLKLQSVVAKVEQDRHDNVMVHQVALHAKDKLSDGNSFVDWLRRFYERIAEDYMGRIQRYRSTMEQLERYLLSIDQREQFAPQVISDIIHEQNTLFMSMAEQVATLHAEIDMLKKDYVKWYQARFHSVRDPFAPVAAAATERP